MARLVKRQWYPPTIYSYKQTFEERKRWKDNVDMLIIIAQSFIEMMAEDQHKAPQPWMLRHGSYLIWIEGTTWLRLATSSQNRHVPVELWHGRQVSSGLWFDQRHFTTVEQR